MLLSPNFLLLYGMSSLSVFSGFFVLNQYKVYGILNGLTNDSYLATVASIGSVFATLRFVWSTWLDYSTYKVTYGTLLVTQIILNITVPLVASRAGLYAVWVGLFVFCESGHFTLVPNILKRLYGDKATQLYGILFTYTSLCSIAMVLLQDGFLNSVSVSSFNNFFRLNALFSATSFALLLLLFKEEKFVQFNQLS
jgi:hypothetical protein